MNIPHEYGPSTVGHGEAQCIWCLGTNRENAVLDPNHCAERARRDPSLNTIGAQGMSAAARDVLAERRRQVESEGWTAGHDDTHSEGQLAEAAACYALNAARNRQANFMGWWPWSRDWWKPKGQRRDLVRAAALLVAEIERLDRQGLGGSSIAS